ncbi:uncharacterized protein LOC143043016 [Mytilus galloprovincialis]|uniref:uncharacterized protein LOC143043016 n=1 Tax=Mytilus galloprovincialis TaxID=29158 RepID=UPI003F7BE64C
MMVLWKDTAPTLPFTVLGYFGTSPSVDVYVIDHPVTWQEASQNCFSHQFFELFAESSVNKLLEHLDEVKQMLHAKLWPADKHLWIGYLYNGTSYLMVDDGKCVTSADLFPLFYINGGTECILLNVAATTASESLIAVPCDQQHEYLCEFPLHVNIDSTRYQDMDIEINTLDIFSYKIIPRYFIDITECEQEMKSRKMAFAAVFYRTKSTCQLYEKSMFEFPEDVRIVTSTMFTTTFVKTAGHTVTIRQRNEMQTSHTSLIENCFPTDPQMTSTITSAMQTENETIKTTEKITMEPIDVLPTLQTEETTRILALTEGITFQTPEDLTMKRTDEISISATEKVTTLKIGETDHTDGVLCSSSCCNRVPKPLNNSFIGEMVLDNMRVNKTLLSSYRRKRTSVKDSRISSSVIGYCATIPTINVFLGGILKNSY